MSLPKREELLHNLKSSPFDLLVIGGGATGAGVALDAALRGYRVALVEAGDFASQTSSRSTKLFHGGVRYLEKAFTHLDWDQFLLVKEGLEERAILLNSIPHLTCTLPILIPVYTYFDAMYYWMGIKVYDLLAGNKAIGTSRFVSRSETMTLFPHLKKKGLKGGVLYYDGQFDDTRFNLSVIFKAIEQGAIAVNYVKAIDLISQDGQIEGAVVRDVRTGDSWPVFAKVTVNATGPFADSMRQCANSSLPCLIKGSSGAHLTLSSSYTPQGVGLLIPKTSDGRILFLLPWKGNTLVGTTDVARDVSVDPSPTLEEIAYLLEHVNGTIEERIEKKEVQAVWAGIRPLIAEMGEADTKKLLRDFQIEKSAVGFYSLLGGKWTAFRRMAETFLDQIIQEGVLPKKGECCTKNVPWEILKEMSNSNENNGLEEARKMLAEWDPDIQEHLLHTYGNDAVRVAQRAHEKGLGRRLLEGYPYLEVEVAWAVKEEYALTVKDLLYRRIPLAMVDREAAERACSRVVELMAEELGWGEERVRQEVYQSHPQTLNFD